MTVYVRLWGICLISFLISSCSTHSDVSFYESPSIDQDLKLHKIDQFTIQVPANTAYTIGKLRFTFATNPAGSLHAFYDELKKQFIITDREGMIQNIISEEGRGPGEILKAEGFNFDREDRLVVYDQNQQMIKVFNLDGEVVARAKPEKSSFYISGRKLWIYRNKIFSATMDGRLLGNIREEAYKSRLAVAHNYDGELVDTMGRYDPTVRTAKSYNLLSIINIDFKRNRLISTHYHNYRIQVYDVETGERLAWFGRKTENFKEGEEYISPNLPREKIQEKSVGRSSAANIYPLSDYIVLYFETLTEAFFTTEDFNEKRPHIVVYDNESYGCYGEIALPYVLGNVSNDKFYLIEDDNPDHFTVGVYELVSHD